MSVNADRSTRRPRVLVVFGSSSGIGLATAVQAAQQGNHVVLVARGVESLDRAVEQCRLAGAASVVGHSADIVDQTAVQRVLDDTLTRHDRLDAVVNSAGVVAYGRFEDVPPDVFDHVLDTNVTGTANVARAALPILRAQGSGHLILLGSLLGHMAPPYMSAYSVSKWAVRGLVRSLQIENRDRPDVHVSYVSPGGVDTPIYLTAGNYLGQVGRPPPPIATPERVAAVVLDLLDRPRSRVQVGIANPLIIFGFTAFPRLYDTLVTPLFEIAATDQRQRVAAGTGNVFTSSQDQNGLRGHQGNPAFSILAGAALTARRAILRKVAR